MRNFVATGLVAVWFGTIAATSLAVAQEPATQALTGPQMAVEPRLSRSQQIVHERAAERAKYRTARIETRKWLGQSSLRPSMGSEPPVLVRYGWWGNCGAIVPPQAGR
jgi:hypothetical protein